MVKINMEDDRMMMPVIADHERTEIQIYKSRSR